MNFNHSPINSQPDFLFLATSVGALLSALNIVVFYDDDSLLFVSPPITGAAGAEEEGWKKERERERWRFSIRQVTHNMSHTQGVIIKS